MGCFGYLRFVKYGTWHWEENFDLVDYAIPKYPKWMVFIKIQFKKYNVASVCDMVITRDPTAAIIYSFNKAGDLNRFLSILESILRYFLPCNWIDEFGFFWIQDLPKGKKMPFSTFVHFSCHVLKVAFFQIPNMNFLFWTRWHFSQRLA